VSKFRSICVGYTSIYFERLSSCDSPDAEERYQASPL
jgi:hypothetical protein